MTTLSMSEAERDPAAALSWDGSNPTALVVEAERLTRDGAPGSLATAAGLARAALRVEPLLPRALAVLALDADQEGHEAVALRIMRVSASFSARILVAVGWLYAHDLKTGAYDDATRMLDAIARGHPEVVDALCLKLAPMLNNPKFNDALARRLETRPPWREWFLGILTRQDRNSAGLIRLFAGLQNGNAGPTDTELRPLLVDLVTAKKYDEAYLLWLRALPKGRLADLTFLYNGHFEYPVSDMPFDWTLVPTEGAVLAVVPTERGSALTVGFLGSRAPFYNVVHDMMLAPGSYRLQGLVKADHLEGAMGVRWRLACAEQPAGALGTSEPVSGTSDWKPFVMDFDVGDTDCRAQSLVLEPSASDASGTAVSGVVTYANLDIESR